MGVMSFGYVLLAVFFSLVCAIVTVIVNLYSNLDVRSSTQYP